jgi:fumarate reductase subunit D
VCREEPPAVSGIVLVSRIWCSMHRLAFGVHAVHLRSYCLFHSLTYRLLAVDAVHVRR